MGSSKIGAIQVASTDDGVRQIGALKICAFQLYTGKYLAAEVLSRKVLPRPVSSFDAIVGVSQLCRSSG